MTEIDYQLFTGYPDDKIFQEVAFISNEIFPGTTEERALQFNRTILKGKKNILTIIAYQGDQPVGYKQGFESRPGYFESDTGGVIESARRRGIAHQMLLYQQEWCVNNGFRFINTSTGTVSDNNAMLILNLKNGFTVVGTYLDRGSNHRVLLQKQIAEM